MVVCQAIGAGHVAGADGADHLLVLIRQQAAVVGLFDVVEVEVQDAAALVQQLLIEGCKVGVPSGARDGHVEMLVGLRHGEVVSGVHSGNEALLGGLDLLDVLIGTQFRREPGVDALREVERTGRLADEVATPAVPDSEASSRDEGAQPAHVRDMLTACVERDATVQFACAQRGSTALIHGEKGASAERAARGAREITTASRALARKLGLGALREVRCEHALDDQATATVLVQASDHGSAAVRVTGTAHERHTRALVAMVHALDTGAAR